MPILILGLAGALLQTWLQRSHTVPDPLLIDCFVWVRFLFLCAVLIGLIQFVWTRFIPDRWKVPIQLPPEQQKKARLIHGCIGYAFVALLLLGGLLQKL
jgi:hypothetical protein